MSGPAGFLCHPLLDACGVAHGFGTRGAREPAGLVCARQVHGAAVLRVGANGREGPAEADALVSDAPGVPVGVVTADCVPVLVASPHGDAVSAVHVGWRGLAHDVLGTALRRLAEIQPEAMRGAAAVGPHVGSCCYEVDEPVVEALASQLGASLDGMLHATRPGHWTLDLGAAVRSRLARAGLDPERIGAFPGVCTACDSGRFHSFRRDGSGAGRMLHFVAASKRGLDTPRGPA